MAEFQQCLQLAKTYDIRLTFTLWVDKKEITYFTLKKKKVISLIYVYLILLVSDHKHISLSGEKTVLLLRFLMEEIYSL